MKKILATLFAAVMMFMATVIAAPMANAATSTTCTTGIYGLRSTWYTYRQPYYGSDYKLKGYTWRFQLKSRDAGASYLNVPKATLYTYDSLGRVYDWDVIYNRMVGPGVNEWFAIYTPLAYSYKAVSYVDVDGDGGSACRATIYR